MLLTTLSSHTSNPHPLPDRLPNGSADIAAAAQSDIAEIGEEVKQQAAALGEEAKAQFGEMTQKAKGVAGEQKDLLAGQLGGVSEALMKVAGELEANEESSAQYARMVADGAQKLTSTLRDNDVDDILRMAQDFGRKQPAAFLGATALLGFAASRFVTASATRRMASTDTRNASRNEQSQPGFADLAQPEGGKDGGI